MNVSPYSFMFWKKNCCSFHMLKQLHFVIETVRIFFNSIYRKQMLKFDILLTFTFVRLIVHWPRTVFSKGFFWVKYTHKMHVDNKIREFRDRKNAQVKSKWCFNLISNFGQLCGGKCFSQKWMSWKLNSNFLPLKYEVKSFSFNKF